MPLWTGIRSFLALTARTGCGAVGVSAAAPVGVAKNSSIARRRSAGAAKFLSWFRRRPRWAVLAVGGVVSLGSGCGGQEAPPAARHVVLVTIDTLRADRVGAYGNTQVATVHLDGIARDGALAEQVTAHVPLTRPSHVSIFTGLLPSEHGIRDNTSPGVLPDVPLLAELFRNNGFRTAAFVSAIVIGTHTGLPRGFDLYSADFGTDSDTATFLNTAQKSGELTVAEAIAWLQEPWDGRRFAWVHLYEPPEGMEALIAEARGRYEVIGG